MHRLGWVGWGCGFSFVFLKDFQGGWGKLLIQNDDFKEFWLNLSPTSVDEQLDDSCRLVL